MKFTALTYNVHSCIGLDGQCAPGRIAEVIASCDADIVALQEIDVGRRRSGQVNQHAVIAELVQMKSSFYAALRYEDEEYGGALLSRLPFELVKTGALPGHDRLEPRGALWARVEVHGFMVNVLTTHLGLRPFERNAQVHDLLGSQWMADLAFTPPAIVCGDFNFTPLSPLHRRIARKLRSVRQAVRRPFSYGTFMGVLALDHIFVSSDLKVNGVHVPRTPAAQVASDHRPLVARLEIMC
ncbi:MAG: endonuclease/exonuclease/phosphatase family protein [Candidatus Hydrogenedentes bacterium]|nr:endonuclease/exonuclease/phosphatase family protein [Candidatus Hydrogenedentota bacterium]